MEYEVQPVVPPSSPEPEQSERGIRREQWYLIAVMVAFTVAGALYRGLVAHNLNHTALMFLGVPLVLAVVLALSPKAESATGGIMKGMTLALLLLAPLLGEGMICILIASPLFYLIGLIVGWILDRQRGSKGLKLSCVSVLLLPLCLEGTTPAWTVERTQTVSATRVVDAPVANVEAALAQSPALATVLPAALKIGFPVPLEASGSGLQVGAARTIHFTGAEGAPPGDVTVRITQSGPGHLHSVVTCNETKLAQWLEWTGMDVTWHAIDASHTSVTWTIAFERNLDPAWYFAPLEGAAVREVAAYMIAANATPHGPRP